VLSFGRDFFFEALADLVDGALKARYVVCARFEEILHLFEFLHRFDDALSWICPVGDCSHGGFAQVLSIFLEEQ